MKNPNALMSFGQAIEAAKQGIAVSAQGWDFIDRLTSPTPADKQVPLDQIWSPENRRIGALMGQKELTVKPYFTKMTRQGIENYIPTNEDMFDAWMVSDYFLHCASISVDYDHSDSEINMSFSVMTDSDAAQANLPFAQLYQQKMIGYHNNIYFIAGNESSNKLNATIFNTLVQHTNNRMAKETFDGFIINQEFYKDGWTEYCDPIAVAEYKLITINEKDFDIDEQLPEHCPINVIVDVGSLIDLNLPTGDSALDFVTAQLERMNQTNLSINWVEFDLGDELSASAAANKGEE